MRSAELACHCAARRCAILSLAALGGCSRESPPAERWLEVDQVRPEKNVGVFLNERIQLHFSEPLDPTSVNARSVRIRSTRDALARGELQVEEDNLIFVPEPVLAADLSDGGYQPGATYFVELAGFPRPDGLRGRSGAPLHHNVRWEFHTVELTEPRVDFVFEDSSPSRGLPVLLRSGNVAPGDPIVLEGEEPLDPSTLFGEDFVLRREKVEEQGNKVRPPLSEPIPLHARMLTNFDKAATHGSGTALIELTPINRLLEPGIYFLAVDAQRCRLQDFGGNRVPVWIRGPTRRQEVIVSQRATSGLEVSSEFLASFFEDETMRSLEALEDFDGTAYWGKGRVEMHWPAAAGSGAAGAVTLGATEARRDIQSTRMLVPEGVRCELDPTPGLCVLRAQGKLSIKGILSRRSQVAHTDAPALDGREMFTPARGADGTFPSLSAALARARELDFDATIVIAGGDLVVDGRIVCDGPLLLVAGGRIRAAHVDSSWLYYLGEGGGALAAAHDTAREATLVPDAPTRNPLVEPLRFGAVSASIPPEGRAVRWHVAPQVGAHAGKGSARVRYVGERAADGSGGPREIVVDDPGALTDCPTLRLRIELGLSPPVPPETPDTVPPDPKTLPWDAWDPPWVDYVLLELDQAPRGAR